MTDRLTTVDASYLSLEGRTTPMHVGGIAIFEPPPEGLRYERLVELLEQRISLVPRYRQKVREVPGRLANPVWVDDPTFDITFHVRRSALPKPGTQTQLLEFCARIQSRPLDRARPLWEVYFIEGLADGRIAIASKTHLAVVDGVRAVDIGQLMLDEASQPPAMPDELWMPAPEPSSADLILDVVLDAVRRPAAIAEAARLGIRDAGSTARRISSVATGAVSAAIATVRPAPASPLNTAIGEQRRLAAVRTSLGDYKTIRRVHGGTVNDVVLATIAGALRSWFLFRGASVRSSSTVRVAVPMSVWDGSGVDTPSFGHGPVGLRPEGPSSEDARSGGPRFESHSHGPDVRGMSRLAAELVDLPVGEPNPVLRLAQISYLMRERARLGQWAGADALVALAGVTLPTVHALGTRAVSTLTRRLANLALINVPGPQFPLYAAGARLVETYPIVPLTAGHAVSIGLTSYDGTVFYGLNADRDVVGDLDVLASMITESLAELVAASDDSRRARRTGRLTAVPGRAGSAAQRQRGRVTDGAARTRGPARPTERHPVGRSPVGTRTDEEEGPQ